MNSSTFRSFILNVYTDLDFLLLFYFYFFYIGKWQGCSHFGLFLSYVALHSQHAKPKKRRPCLFGMVFDGGLFCNSAK